MAGRRIAAALMDGFQHHARRPQRQARAAIFLGDQRAKKTRLGQRLDEVGGVFIRLIELQPVLIGEVITKLATASRISDQSSTAGREISSNDKALGAIMFMSASCFQIAPLARRSAIRSGVMPNSVSTSSVWAPASGVAAT
jgi:hypothetical protein